MHTALNSEKSSWSVGNQFGPGDASAGSLERDRRFRGKLRVLSRSHLLDVGSEVFIRVKRYGLPEVPLIPDVAEPVSTAKNGRTISVDNFRQQPPLGVSGASHGGERALPRTGQLASYLLPGDHQAPDAGCTNSPWNASMNARRAMGRIFSALNSARQASSSP